MLLAIIDRTDKEGLNQDIQRLADLGKFFKTHVEYMLENLLDDGLITIDDDLAGRVERSRQSSDVSSGGDSKSIYEEPFDLTHSSPSVTVALPKRKQEVATHHLSLTAQGRAALKEKKDELAKLSVDMQRLYNAKNLDELYKTIFWNKEWIPLMLYTGVMTPEYLKAMLKILGVDAYRITLTEVQEAISDFGVGPDYLSLGTLFYDGIHAIVSFILSHVLVGKLEGSQPEKADPKKNSPNGEFYIPSFG